MTARTVDELIADARRLADGFEFRALQANDGAEHWHCISSRDLLRECADKLEAARDLLHEAG